MTAALERIGLRLAARQHAAAAGLLGASAQTLDGARRVGSATPVAAAAMRALTSIGNDAALHGLYLSALSLRSTALPAWTGRAVVRAEAEELQRALRLRRRPTSLRRLARARARLRRVQP